MENTPFSRFSAGPHHQDHPAVLGGILDSGGLASIFAGLEPAGFLYLKSFAAKIPGDTMPIWPLYVHPSPCDRTG
jgi:hypothetical protein